MDKKNSVLGKKEEIAIIIGFALIMCVLIFTFIRSINWQKSPGSTDSSDQNAVQHAADYDTISSNDLGQLIRENKGVIVVDIRSYDAYIAHHILDSINIPIDELAQSSKIKPSDTIFIVGVDSNDSDVPNAVATLKNNHFTNIKVLAGGLAAWEGSGGQTVTFGDPTSFIDQSKVFYVDTAQAHDIIKNYSDSTIILDVRDASMFAQGHVPNAINIPLLDLERRRNELSPLKKILIFGVTDVAEFQAGVQLYDLTQTTAYVVKGAMQSWQDAKFEMTH